MCQHFCTKCGVEWSHQDFGVSLGSIVQLHEPCPFPKIYLANGGLYLADTQTCPRCYEETRRWTKNGLEKVSFKEMLKRMEDKYNGGKLTSAEIVQAQLDIEGVFKVLITKDTADTELEALYFDLLRKMELFRAKALRFRQLKIDWDIEQMSKVSDEDRAAFAEAKLRQKQASRPVKVDVAKIKRSKEEKMINSFADKILAAHPEMSQQEALERAMRMFG